MQLLDMTIRVSGTDLATKNMVALVMGPTPNCITKAVIEERSIMFLGRTPSAQLVQVIIELSGDVSNDDWWLAFVNSSHSWFGEPDWLREQFGHFLPLAIGPGDPGYTMPYVMELESKKRNKVPAA